ncbi:MAG: L,D-transpeptidase family protein [Chloroflexi bacterium]|nr:L,D-transpeptidase family protein [Chloroflexota bacterium]
MKTRIRIFPSLLLILSFVGIGLALFFFAASPAGASFFAPPAPTQEALWAYAYIPRAAPTVTPLSIPTETLIASPTPIPTLESTPTESPTLEPTATEAPGEMVMEIVENTPTPEYVAVEPGYASDSSYSGSKYILVDISEQHMYVYEGDTLIYSFVASTGMNNATRTGLFHVQSKIPNAYGSTWNIWMPSWLGIYWAGGLENGIHALPILPNGSTLWAGFLGRPVSYGCVVLGSYEAQLLYDWAELGTPVEIRW